ncbi:pyridoxal phosphate-dependent aminotransferase [Cytobacillus kochii]|uniref:MalY/PatB family protein n=1 Tax=Cytobacillus kochii TaxID=859143 RepID=UPI002E1F13BE|nr:pyridoxal phosphate-dependent aminotransferase [Cytobacillus kochii]
MENQYFHEIFDRKNTSSVKWELTKTVFGEEDVLPMWVADMDFKPPKEVTNALQKRLDHGIYGYTFASPSLPKVIKDWVSVHHGWDIPLQSILYNTGVVPSLAAVVQTYTEEGDNILIHTPVYPPFTNVIESNHRKVLRSPLKLVNGHYKIDFDDFEQQLKKGAKMFILCNPHNPGGNVWSKKDLQKIGDLCIAYDCLILSDEIHADLVYKPKKHVAIASLSEELRGQTITCIAPTKTFNIAGLQASALIIPNETLRKKFEDFQARQGFHQLSIFGMVGMEAAYTHGTEWLEALLSYLQQNIQSVKSFIEKELPDIDVVDPEGTYLIWLDCRKLGLTDDDIQQKLVKKGKLGLEPGPKYGPGGEGFVRMNIACPHDILMDGLHRLKTAFS